MKGKQTVVITCAALAAVLLTVSMICTVPDAHALVFSVRLKEKEDRHGADIWDLHFTSWQRQDKRTAMRTIDGSNGGIPYFTGSGGPGGTLRLDNTEIQYTRADGSTYWLPIKLELALDSGIGFWQKYFGDRLTLNLAGTGGVGEDVSDSIIGHLVMLKPPLQSMQVFIGTDKDGNWGEVPEFKEQ